MFIVKDKDVANTYPIGTFVGFEVSVTGPLIQVVILPRHLQLRLITNSIVETYTAVSFKKTTATVE